MVFGIALFSQAPCHVGRGAWSEVGMKVVSSASMF
jgi:hypothetical protein